MEMLFVGITMVTLWLWSFIWQMDKHTDTIKELNDARAETAKWRLIAKLHGYKEE